MHQELGVPQTPQHGFTNSGRPAATIRLAAAVLLTIYSSFVSLAFIFFLTRNLKEGGWAGLVLIGMLMLVGFLTFVVSTLIMTTVRDTQQLRQAVLFLGILITLYPFILTALSWWAGRKDAREEKWLTQVTAVQDCDQFAIVPNWSSCVQKTIHTEEDLRVCQEQGSQQKNRAEKRSPTLCQSAFNAWQAKLQQDAALASVQSVADCSQFVQNISTASLLNHTDGWVQCILKTAVSAADIEECYRQVRMPPQRNTFSDMNNVCMNKKKEVEQGGVIEQ